MTRQNEVDILWGLATTKKKGWQQSDCPCVRGDYGDLERAWNTVTMSMNEGQRIELVKLIELAMQAQARFRRDSRAAGDFVPQPKLIGAWIRAKRWMDEIESHADLKDRKSKVRLCSCGAETIGPSVPFCISCYPSEAKGRPGARPKKPNGGVQSLKAHLMSAMAKGRNDQ